MDDLYNPRYIHERYCCGTQYCSFVTCFVFLFLINTRVEAQTSAKTQQQFVVSANGLNNPHITRPSRMPSSNRGKGVDKQRSHRPGGNQRELEDMPQGKQIMMEIKGSGEEIEKEKSSAGNLEKEKKEVFNDNILTRLQETSDVGHLEEFVSPLPITALPFIQPLDLETTSELVTAPLSETKSRELYDTHLLINENIQNSYDSSTKQELSVRKGRVNDAGGALKHIERVWRARFERSEQRYDIITNSVKTDDRVWEKGTPYNDICIKLPHYCSDNMQRPKEEDNQRTSSPYFNRHNQLRQVQSLEYIRPYPRHLLQQQLLMRQQQNEQKQFLQQQNIKRFPQQHKTHRQQHDHQHQKLYHAIKEGNKQEQFHQSVTSPIEPYSNPIQHSPSQTHRSRIRREVKEQQSHEFHNNKNIRARKEGAVIIGALFPLHQAPTQKTAYTRQCGDIREYYGIQRVEAFLMTLEKINNNTNILPHIKLGWDIRDSCWYSAIALENSIDFIKDAIASQAPGQLEQDVSSNAYPEGTPLLPAVEATFRSSSSPPVSVNDSSTSCVAKKRMKPIAGLVGPGSSDVTIQVQNLLQIFNIPQIGYSATSIDLSDKSHYKYFLRVVPPDRHQAQALVDVVVRFNWTYISTVHSDGNYGVRGMEKFIDLATERGVCIATSDNVASSAEDDAFDNVLDKLLKVPNATVVVCFCEGMTVKKLLQATVRRGLEGRFLVVGSDGWGNRLDVVEGHEAAALGAISIKLYSPLLENFDAHYAKLRPHQSTENPWFHMFWQQKFKCSLDFKKLNFRGFSRFCTGNESLAGSDQDSKLGFVVNAVQTMAKALDVMHKDLCPGVKGLCPAMDPISGSVYLDYLLNVSFTSYSGEMVHFDVSGDPPGRYEILNYQKIIAVDGNISHDYVTIGHWMTGSLTLNGRPVHRPRMYNGQVKSVCSEPCSWGQAKKVKGVTCCWICTTCLDNEILIENNTDCRACDLGHWPNANKTDCEQIVVDFINLYDTEAVVCVTVSCLGILSTMWVAVIFIRFHDTPVVKASTRELSYIILVGIALAFSANFFIVAKPEQGFCYLTRILPGLSFSLIYGALVTKTNRIARILEGSKRISTKKPRFMSATAQVVITAIIIGIECAVITGMLIYQPANSKLDYPAPKRVRLVCDTSTLGIIVPLGFDLVLILLCTIYAVKTRNLPENFNEAKFIGFTMYATCIIWSGFFPIYFAGENKEVTLSFSVSLSAAIALILLFLPKVYVIVWVPEKNTRGAFTTSRDVRCHIGSKSLASGDSIDIRESSTFENLFKAEKPSTKQWKQKSLDEKRLRFVMQRASQSDSASSYINHGVINKHTPLGSCSLMIKESRDSARTDSTHISGISSSCSEKDRLFSSGDAVRQFLSSESRLPRKQTTVRPNSPAEREKHRIHNVGNLTDVDQSLLEGVMQSSTEKQRKSLPSNFRKSLSSNCVSTDHTTRSVQCQTGEELIECLLPALRRRCLSKGKHVLERSSAVDAGGQESDTSMTITSYYRSFLPHQEVVRPQDHSSAHERSCLCQCDLSDLSPLVIDDRHNTTTTAQEHHNVSPQYLVGTSPFSRRNSASPRPSICQITNVYKDNHCGLHNHHAHCHHLPLHPTCPQHLQPVCSTVCSRCGDCIPPLSNKTRSPLEISQSTSCTLSTTAPPLLCHNPTSHILDNIATTDSLTDHYHHPHHKYQNHHHHDYHNSLPNHSSTTNRFQSIINAAHPGAFPCHHIKSTQLPTSSNNETSDPGEAQYELSTSPSCPLQLESCSSHTTLSTASSSFTLPAFNTSTDSNKSIQSLFSDSNENDHNLELIGARINTIPGIVTQNNDDNDDEDDADDSMDSVNETTPLRGDNSNNFGNDGNPGNVIPLNPLVIEANTGVLEFQQYLQCHGVNLDFSSDQCSDL